MDKFHLNTPIAFFIFNRPEVTQRVFSEIARARPPMLLVVGDGARPDRNGEAIKVAMTRSIVDQVDWPCEVLTNFSKANMGCKNRVSSGLDWVFEHTEEAIILEDDCLPHPTFFRFCEEMLVRYRHDHRIGMISGDNFQFGYRINDDSYYFSNNTHIWGWATWRSRWQNDYDVDMKNWPKIKSEGRVADWVITKPEKDFLTDTFDRVYNGKIDTWDYQWYFANLLSGRISVMPNVNLISNIGFGEEATHTTANSEFSAIPVEEIYFPLKHPIAFSASTVLDSRYSKGFSRGYFNRLKVIIANLIHGNNTK